MTDSTTVDSSEKVARILSTEWFVDGQLMNIAFTLLEGETYISVNRPVISTYDSDIASFVAKHDKYLFGTDNYKRAIKVRTQLLKMSTVEQMVIYKSGESID